MCLPSSQVGWVTCARGRGNDEGPGRVARGLSDVWVAGTAVASRRKVRTGLRLAPVFPDGDIGEARGTRTAPTTRYNTGGHCGIPAPLPLRTAGKAGWPARRSPLGERSEQGSGSHRCSLTAI
ncbi:hypothetical protein GCM10022380_26440 [Amycolatopsis tucumanensis]|uniref:Uncharacterized protein n=1 Tax=Amycolatopsis tucumanensis TaxID=401106 RepID=A0ABP7I240_9PSEU